jgi:quinoprotein glucose dehydrogenase
VSGKTLWESPVLQGGGVATPITYELDGKQHVAVMAGVSKGRIFDLAVQ